MQEAGCGSSDSGAKFAFAFGSRAEGRATEKSDVDVAAWWGIDVPDPWTVRVPGNVDLPVLDTAPLELAGRVAQRGVLLFDDDPHVSSGRQRPARSISTRSTASASTIATSSPGEPVVDERRLRRLQQQVTERVDVLRKHASSHRSANT